MPYALLLAYKKCKIIDIIEIPYFFSNSLFKASNKNINSVFFLLYNIINNDFF